MNQISNETIANFLEGHNEKKYVVAIETSYNTNIASVIISDPDKGKIVEYQHYKSFVWITETLGKRIFQKDRSGMIELMKRKGIKIKTLQTKNSQGFEPERMANGYKFMLEVNGSYNDITGFIKASGVNPNDDFWRSQMKRPQPVEQFMIQTGIRLFKGIEDYDDLIRFQFDLETDGLLPEIHRINQIGIRTNKGFEHILALEGETPKELRDSERNMIRMFSASIKAISPDLLTGYNSEDFDWGFLEVRCRILGLNFSEIFTGMDGSGIQRKNARLKLGGDTISYQQAYLWGYNVLDISHAVRKTMAINSDIKKWNLKYITQWSEIEKSNRVYVDGDKISKIWGDKDNEYLFNNTNGKHTIHKIGVNSHLLDEGYEIVTGKYIVDRYLIDDLWETDKVDEKFNQASFLLSKIIPTTYMRSSTMGTAGIWSLIMQAWSYEKGLAIPLGEEQQTFTGGLSRLLEVGYRKRVLKLDYAALYPNIEITYDLFPDHDITGVMKGFLVYIAETRDIYKGLMGQHSKKAKKLKEDIDAGKYVGEELKLKQEEMHKHHLEASKFDTKQLPIKILANSFFGSYGASYLFSWGDLNFAEETTCIGRQALRLMVEHFYYKYKFVPLVCDSVTHDTPVYIRCKHTGYVSIKPIEELFNDGDVLKVGYQDRDMSEKPYSVLTVNGWKDVSYIYRHKNTKDIHRVTTKDRMVDVTSDHSLFQNKIEIKPKDLIRGDKLDVYDYYDHELYCRTDIDELDGFDEGYLWMLGYFLGDGSSLERVKKTNRFSTQKNKMVTYESKTTEFKISGVNLEKLNKLKDVLERHHPDLNFSIKDHMESSSVYNLVCYNVKFAKWFNDNFYTKDRLKSVPSFILNTTKENKRAFLNGLMSADGYGDCLETSSSIGLASKVAMAGVSILLRTLDIDYKLIIRNDKPNFINFKLKNHNRNNSSFTDKTIMQTDEVWHNKIIDYKGEYVYDISTGDGTFIGGIGMINLKNTDGANFSVPDSADDVRYTCKGTHRFTEKNKGVELEGVDAIVAEFNELYMEGRMGLDIDEYCESTINFSRKNYANKILKEGKTKVKMVGNTIKSVRMPIYIEEFIDKGVRFLLDGKGLEFIELYYEVVNNIVNYNIPLSKIASKARVRQTYEQYDLKCKSVNKAGNPMPRQAHMELAIKHNLPINIGDTIYYINTGTGAKDGDLKTIKDKETGKISEIVLNCKLLPIEEVENNPDATTNEYNAYKYLEMFNTRIRRLLVCFNPAIRDKIIINYVDNKEMYDIVNGRKKYVKELEPRNYFRDDECELCNGYPLDEVDQDDVELDLMLMDDREVEFWKRVGKVPFNMSEEYWKQFLVDYEIRVIETKKYNDFIDRKNFMMDLFNLTLEDIENFKQMVFPDWMNKKYKIKPIFENDDLVDIKVSNIHNTNDLTSFENIFKYKDIIGEIEEWKSRYKTKKTLNAWLKHIGDELDYNIYYNFLYGRKYDDDLNNIHFVPRVYKDYDALYAEADKVIND